jgi:hypothetical protein
MACYVALFLLVQSRYVNAKGGELARVRFRRGQVLSPRPGVTCLLVLRHRLRDGAVE